MKRKAQQKVKVFSHNWQREIHTQMRKWAETVSVIPAKKNKRINLQVKLKLKKSRDTFQKSLWNATEHLLVMLPGHGKEDKLK